MFRSGLDLRLGPFSCAGYGSGRELGHVSLKVLAEIEVQDAVEYSRNLIQSYSAGQQRVHICSVGSYWCEAVSVHLRSSIEDSLFAQ